MDNAVALVNAYLRLKGYFTVTEYPILATSADGIHRAVTDLDVLAFRFAGARAHSGSTNPKTAMSLPTHSVDPALQVPEGTHDMIVGEVKEGRVVLNDAATNHAVLSAALVRFGCCEQEEVDGVVEALMRHGRAVARSRHTIRMVAFGSIAGLPASSRYTRIALGDVVRFLTEHIRTHWDVLRHSDTKDPAFGFLMTLEKAITDHR